MPAITEKPHIYSMLFIWIKRKGRTNDNGVYVTEFRCSLRLLNTKNTTAENILIKPIEKKGHPNDRETGYNEMKIKNV